MSYIDVYNIICNIDDIIKDNNKFEEYIFDLEDYTTTLQKEDDKNILNEMYRFYMFLSYLYILKRMKLYKINIPENISNPLFYLSSVLLKTPYISNNYIITNDIFNKIYTPEFITTRNFIYNKIKLMNESKDTREQINILKDINIKRSILCNDINNNFMYIKKCIIYENNDIIHHTINMNEMNINLCFNNNINTNIILLNELYNFQIISLKESIMFYKDKSIIEYYLSNITNTLENICVLLLKCNVNNEMYSLIDNYYKKVYILEKQLIELRNNSINNILKWQNI